jgi:hypothetical protein
MRNKNFNKREKLNKEGLDVHTFQVGLPQSAMKFYRAMIEEEGLDRVEDVIEIYLDEYLKSMANQVRKRVSGTGEVNVTINVLGTKYKILKFVCNMLGMSETQFIQYVAINIARRYRSKKRLPARIYLAKDR